MTSLNDIHGQLTMAVATGLVVACALGACGCQSSGGGGDADPQPGGEPASDDPASPPPSVVDPAKHDALVVEMLGLGFESGKTFGQQVQPVSSSEVERREDGTALVRVMAGDPARAWEWVYYPESKRLEPANKLAFRLTYTAATIADGWTQRDPPEPGAAPKLKITFYEKTMPDGTVATVRVRR